jgi:SAM-dependent methyltransferase
MLELMFSRYVKSRKFWLKDWGYMKRTEKNFPELSFGASLRIGLITKHWVQINPKKALEVGCGQGRISARLEAITSEFHACEPDMESYEIARELLKSNRVYRTKASELPKIGSFDMFFSSEVLEHIENDSQELSTWSNLLQPQGYILITVPAHPSLYGFSDRKVGHYRRYSKKKIIRLVESSGFKVLSTELVGGVGSFLLLGMQNLVAVREGWSEQTEEAGLSSGRWHQPSVEKSKRAYLKKIFTALTNFPKNFGTTLLLVAQKID